MSVGFAIIGCGAVSQTHAQAISSLPGAHFVGAFDQDPAAAKQLTDTFGGRVFRTLAEVAACPEVAIATIATPSGYHLEPAQQLAAAGKHLLVEKPLEISVARGQTLLAACRSAGVKLGSIFPYRFATDCQQVHTALTKGEFGTVVVANLTLPWNRTTEYFTDKPWRGQISISGGGVLLNQAIHGLDLMQWWLGPVTAVAAFTAQRIHQNLDVEDTAVGILQFASGAVGTIAATLALSASAHMQLTIHGSQRSASLRNGTLVPSHSSTSPSQSVSAATNHACGTHKFQKHQRQFADFVEAVRENREPLVDGQAGIAAVALIESLYQAAASGQRTLVPDISSLISQPSPVSAPVLPS